VHQQHVLCNHYKCSACTYNVHPRVPAKLTAGDLQQGENIWLCRQMPARTTHFPCKVPMLSKAQQRHIHYRFACTVSNKYGHLSFGVPY